MLVLYWLIFVYGVCVIGMHFGNRRGARRTQVAGTHSLAWWRERDAANRYFPTVYYGEDIR